jgi:glycosyltransferase involved in cell wall biosynthesis
VGFSVIIPTRNRPAPLARCLNALQRLEWPRARMEVVVVDDGGERSLEMVAASFQEVLDIQLCRIAHSGPGVARNHGARVARNPWLAFTDDDCAPSSGWLTEIAAALEDDPEVLAGGSIQNGLPANPCAEASQVIHDAAYQFFNADPDKARFLASNNMACHRAAFLSAGGFDPAFDVASEDRELCDRWRWLRRPIRFVPAARVQHCHDLSVAGFLRQHIRYGRGAALFHRVRSRRATGSHFSDLSFYAQWHRLLFRRAIASARPFSVVGLLTLWQVANTAGFCYENLLQWTQTKRSRAQA